jgi:hypothetical protein
MPKRDITKLNFAVDQLLAATQNPRHRFMLQSYSRHRYLEVAGRYEEIFAPDMTSERPVYHFHFNNLNAELVGNDVKSLYRMWAKTNQSIFYVEREQIAVADNFVASVTLAHQQVAGRSLLANRVLSHLPGFLSERLVKRALAAKDFKVDENSMYLYSNLVEMIWPYDDRGRLVGEDVWEPEPDKATIVKLDPADVLTSEEAGKALAHLIKPLPSFDETVLNRAA